MAGSSRSAMPGSSARPARWRFANCERAVAAVPAGSVTVKAVSDRTVNDAAAVEPKWTAEAPVKPLPSTVMVSPPRALPVLAVTLLTVGVVLLYVKWSALLVAEGRLSSEAIAAKCGVTAATIEAWRLRPEFAAEVEGHREAYRELLSQRSSSRAARDARKGGPSCR